MRTILIIGGGVAGPVAALRFARDGHKCIIFERASGPQTIGGAINLAPNGFRMITTLGVGEETKKRACLVPELEIRDEKGSLLGTFANSSKDGFTGLRLMRSDLQAVLLEEIRRQGIAVNYRKNLSETREVNGKVIATFLDGTAVEGDMLIGADGIHSKVREYVVGDSSIQPQYTGQSLIYGIVPMKDVPDIDAASLPKTTAVFCKRGFFAAAFTNERRESLYWFCGSEKEQAEFSVDAAKLRAEASARFGDVFAPFPRCIEATNEFFAWPTFRLPELKSWYRGNVVLVGDAAHALPPNGGQGVSQAMEDVFCLARVVAAGKDLARFQELRAPRINKLRGNRAAQGREKEKSEWGLWATSWMVWSALSLYRVWTYFWAYDMFAYDIDKIEV